MTVPFTSDTGKSTRKGNRAVSNKITRTGSTEAQEKKSLKADGRPVTAANVTLNPLNVASRGHWPL